MEKMTTPDISISKTILERALFLSKVKSTQVPAPQIVHMDSHQDNTPLQITPVKSQNTLCSLQHLTAQEKNSSKTTARSETYSSMKEDLMAIQSAMNTTLMEPLRESSQKGPKYITADDMVRFMSTKHLIRSSIKMNISHS